MTEKTGLLLINLGSPESPRTADVRRYLHEFLHDPRVIDIPPLQRRLLVDLLILPRRPRSSGEAYAKIWTEQGSPLLVHSRELAKKVQGRLPDVAVELAMRYGEPSIEGGLERLRSAEVDRLVVMPLYPQYSSAATGSSVEEVMRVVGRWWNTPALQFIPPFYDHPEYVAAVADLARPLLEAADVERVLLSFHGLPERQIRKSDESGGEHCLQKPGCCARIGAANRNCYRAQCIATAAALADALEIPPEQRIVCFQSRLGRTPWIKPYTDEVLVDLARQGVRRIAVLTPAFVADCLETLEEIGIRARDAWRAAGGEALHLVPCPNASDRWTSAVVNIVRDHTRWL